jgi:hypothetical protein
MREEPIELIAAFEAVYSACKDLRGELEAVLRHERTCKDQACKWHFFAYLPRKG